MPENLGKLREVVPDRARQQEAREYGRLLWRGSLVQPAVGAILLLILFLTPASNALATLSSFPWLIPVLAMLVLALQPVLNWYSRRMERAADETALALSNNPQAFVALMTKLTDQNLAEADPSRWTKLLFYDHPTYNERVKLAHDHISRPQSRSIGRRQPEEAF